MGLLGNYEKLKQQAIDRLSPETPLVGFDWYHGQGLNYEIIGTDYVWTVFDNSGNRVAPIYEMRNGKSEVINGNSSH